jgi:3-deoxy-7-phosphoheptulonate synthase
MIIILKPGIGPDSTELSQIMNYVRRFPDIKPRISDVKGTIRVVTEVYLIGPTHDISSETLERMPGVEKVIRVSSKYRLIGRHGGQMDQHGCLQTPNQPL